MFVLCRVPGSAKVTMKLFVSLLILALVVVAVARKPRTGVNQSGLNFIEPSEWLSESSTLTVATFNIQTGKSLQGVRDIFKSANAITGADIVGVQEVYAQSWLNILGFGQSQSLALTQNGRFGHLFASTRFRWFREHRGNLNLSKLPISKWEIVMLPDVTGKSFRNMTVSHFSWQNQDIVFINTHLHTSKGREQQLKFVLAEFDKYDRVIVVGDFNSKIDTPLLAKIILTKPVTDAISKASLDLDNPDRIDWILTKGFKVNSGEMIEKGISDHPYYEVNLSLNDNL